MACLLVAYLMLQYFLPVPGCPTGYTGPGGLAMPPEQAHCTGGAHRLIDYKIFGAHHIYHNLAEGTNIPVSAATCGDTYGCAVYDPEGTLGFLTATVMTLLGLQAGRIIVNYKNVSPWAMVKRWVAWGLVLCAIATGLCGGTKNDGVMPLCKNLWSPSFIACMAGTGPRSTFSPY
jgi:heparan-alpha-glucosaminide N-acetyltransferase